MSTMADLKRTWLLRYLGVEDTGQSEADLEQEVFTADPQDMRNGLQSAMLVSGSYITSINTSRSTATLTLNRLFLTPIWIPEDMSITSVAAEVTTGVATAVLRLGLYDSDGLKPTTKLFDFGTVDCSTTGRKDIEVTQDIARGLKFLASVGQVASPTVRVMSGPAFNIPSTVPEGTTAPLSFSKTGESGALPTSIPATGTSTAAPPIVWLKVA